MYEAMKHEELIPVSKKRGGRLILKSGHVTDPAGGIDCIMDIAIRGDRIETIGKDIPAKHGDRIIDCKGLYVWPGLIDIHLHISDLYEINTNTAYGAVQDGVTTGLSPGAGNTFMTPALLGAEADRGLPVNVGVYLGGANILGSMLSEEELILLFQGRLSQSVKEQKMSRNWITNQTAQFAVGIKEHMGHFLMDDARLKSLLRIAEESGLLFMSHTQDIAHTRKVCGMAEGRPVHLGHTNAAGCGTHGEAYTAMKEAVTLCKQTNITGEFVTTMLRKGLGCREGLLMDKRAQDAALQALADGVVNIMVSDGQNQSAMKGFGDTRDNIPCILELIENRVLGRKRAVASMTENPARLLYQRTENKEWKRYGNLAVNSYANVTIVSPEYKRATYVITNGIITSFESRYMRSCGKAGYWVSKFGTTKNMGVGELPIFRS